MAEYELIREWIAGRPAHVWLSQQALVAEFIKANKLKPLEVEAYPHISTAGMVVEEQAVAANKTKAAAASTKLRWPKPYPGGLRIPHLHFGVDIYLVSREQWQAFSSAVLRDVSERIANAKAVSFEQTLELAEAVSTLG